MLISFEGLDGCGKTTQIDMLRARLDERQIDHLIVREPGGTEVSERIRSLLLEPSLTIDPFAELLLFSAARAQLVATTIKPALDRGSVVICDRFFDSSTAYQGYGRELADPEWIESLHERATGGLKPERTYYLSVPLSEIHRRKAHDTPDRMEAADDEFRQRVIHAYETLSSVHPARFRVLDGMQPAEALASEIEKDLVDLGLSRMEPGNQG
ncbi:MAG: dTMP kinase [Bacteroidetes bacterium]|nr:dTMP kinase [Bacteroidota bacterium]